MALIAHESLALGVSDVIIAACSSSLKSFWRISLCKLLSDPAEMPTKQLATLTLASTRLYSGCALTKCAAAYRCLPCQRTTVHRD